MKPRNQIKAIKAKNYRRKNIGISSKILEGVEKVAPDKAEVVVGFSPMPKAEAKFIWDKKKG